MYKDVEKNYQMAICNVHKRKREIFFYFFREKKNKDIKRVLLFLLEFQLLYFENKIQRNNKSDGLIAKIIWPSISNVLYISEYRPKLLGIFLAPK